MMKLIMIFIIMISLLYASDESKAIKNTLLKYNYGIIKMGLSGETQFFKEFVKEDLAIKLQVWFESWKFSNLTYIAQINDFRFSPIAFNENNVTIRTVENWSYTYVNLATKKRVLKPTNIFYKMHYTLQKQQGQWVIIDIKKITEEVFLEENRVKKETLNELPKEPKEIPQGRIPTH